MQAKSPAVTNIFISILPKTGNIPLGNDIFVPRENYNWKLRRSSPSPTHVNIMMDNKDNQIEAINQCSDDDAVLATWIVQSKGLKGIKGINTS
jgi:hypothetical protein